MKKSTVIGIVVGLHLIVIGVLVFAQGCQTTVVSKPAPMAEPVSTLPPMELPVERPVAPLPAVSTTAPVPPAKSWDAEPKTYTVKAGDTLGKIASRHGLRVREVAALNNITDPSKLRVGQVLMLPGGDAPAAVKSVQPVVSAPVAAPAAPKRVEPAAAPNGVYAVQAGDTLGKIASRHGTTIAALCAANGIKRDAVLRIGQKIKIAPRDAAPTATVKSAAPAKPASSAKPAESVEAPVTGLAPIEPPVAPAPVSAPATLDLPAPKALELPAATPAVKPAAPALLAAPAPLLDGAKPMALTEYTAEAGDDVELVAKMWSVSAEELRRINNLATDKLTPGQVLKIPPR